MLPLGYLALPVCYYLYRNRKRDRDAARQWFWRNAFTPDSVTNSTDVYHQCENYFDRLEKGEKVTIPPLIVSKTSLVRTSYHYRNQLSRAVVAFLASQNPLDFSDPRAVVLDNVYLLLPQAPNLHHIYPQNFLKNVALPLDVSADSLMNICFIRARTNIQISDKNPLTYFQDFRSVVGFDRILESHLILREYIERKEFRPEDYRESLFSRAEWLGERLKDELPDVDVRIVD